MDDKLLKDKNSECLSMEDLEKVTGGLDAGFSHRLEIKEEHNKEELPSYTPVWNYGRVSE